LIQSMADVVVDANVLVGKLDRNDSLHAQAQSILDRLQRDGHTPLVLDILLQEAISVLCRRAVQRKGEPPDLNHALAVVRGWVENGEVALMHHELAARFPQILDIIESSAGAFNFNDAALIALQRQGVIGEVATLDKALAGCPGFRAIS
jgi:predicted nucleic acid-binding protein